MRSLLISDDGSYNLSTTLVVPNSIALGYFDGAEAGERSDAEVEAAENPQPLRRNSFSVTGPKNEK